MPKKKTRAEKQVEREKDPSTVFPPFRLKTSERKAIFRNAEKLGLSASAYMRRQGVSGKVVIKQSNMDATLIRQLAAIGNNLNQYVKRVNLGGLTAQEHDLLFGTIQRLDKTLTTIFDDTENQ